MLPSESYTTPDEAPSQSLEAETQQLGPTHSEADIVDLPDPLRARTLAEYEYLERKVSDLQLDSKLAPEVLARIFVFCTQETVTLPPSADEPLLILTRICRRWRELALLTSELWANISVVFVQEQQHKMDWVTTVSSQWLSRAGGEYPLCVTAKCAAAYATTLCENVELVAPFVSMVMSHARHLRSIALELPFAALLPFFPLPGIAFPRLQKMSLAPILRMVDLRLPEVGSFSEWHWPSKAVVLNLAPRIEEVQFGPSLIDHGQIQAMAPWAVSGMIHRPTELNDVEASRISSIFFGPNLTLPWSKLTVVAFPSTALTPEAWCSILKECHRLKDLELSVRPSRNVDATFSHGRVQLDHLTDLSLTSFGGGDLLLDALTAPRLNFAALISTGLPLTSFLSFQRRSDFRLQSFFPLIPIPAAEAVSMFEHLLNLKELCVPITPTDHFPELLWQRVGRAELLPHLTTLSIRPTADQAPLLVDTIAARWEAGGHLDVKFVYVEPAHREAVTAEVRRLDKYAERGQSVEIIHSPVTPEV
ncbi:hypothetical protein C8R46DRAFT_1107858 [Mycena filopes]|nr:hypothetical protein C8R46DRAFT_1107858 [Mycena filopes]